MVNIFYHLSIVFPAKSVILLQTPGKILNFNNEKHSIQHHAEQRAYPGYSIEKHLKKSMLYSR